VGKLANAIVFPSVEYADEKGVRSSYAKRLQQKPKLFFEESV
jgi:hypothetical protein